jgi:phosphoribosylformylglycinamidine synthase
MAMDLGLKIQPIGKVGGDVLKVNDVTIHLPRLKDIYFNSFKKVIEQDL